MIQIVTKDYCPYCIAAKDLIKNLWFEYTEIDLTNDNGKMREIMIISEMMTVPQIFVWTIKKENCLGWYSDIRELHEKWILIEKLKKAE